MALGERDRFGQSQFYSGKARDEDWAFDGNLRSQADLQTLSDPETQKRILAGLSVLNGVLLGTYVYSRSPETFQMAAESILRFLQG